MKKINKGVSPAWFETWKTDFKSLNGREPRYEGDFSTDDFAGGQRRRKLRENLIKEQGKICCYCMGRIDNDTAHIEHFWPKGVAEYAHLDLDYNNLFACCEGKRVAQTNADLLVTWDEYCGHKKEDWYDENMVIPTDYGVEDLFTYLENGEIQPISGKSTFDIANKMKTALGLDSFHLTRNRAEAIDQMYEDLELDLLDDPDYIRETIDYYNNMVGEEYMPYCGALVECLKRFLA